MSWPGRNIIDNLTIMQFQATLDVNKTFKSNRLELSHSYTERNHTIMKTLKSSINMNFKSNVLEIPHNYTESNHPVLQTICVWLLNY